MADTLIPSQRSQNMAAIHGKDTKPELIVRKFLWSHGCRYRVNHPRLPGKPDIVLRKYRTCIFVNGCFWHGHNLSIGEREEEKAERCIWAKESRCLEVDVKSSACCKIPRTHTDFWVAKILRALHSYTQPEEEEFLPMAAEDVDEPYGSGDDSPTENRQ